MRHSNAVNQIDARPPISEGGRVFNDDLLLNSGDLEYAANQFPEAIHLIDHPELRETFKKYEKVANGARAKVRLLGLLAVAFGTISLLSAVTEPFWHRMKSEAILTIVFELCGMLAAVIAGGSLWLGPWRKQWLESRFMTERLRQWHFQFLIRKGLEIDPIFFHPDTKTLQTFKAIRKKCFDEFLHDYEGKLDSRMESLVNDPDFSSDWLHRTQTPFSANSIAIGHIYEIYRRLRFNQQYDYVTYKLSESTDRPLWQFLKWPLLRQETAIRGCVSFCFIAALLCSVIVIVNRYFEIESSWGFYLGSATLGIAIVGISLRTIQDGLGITKDIERYRDYRGKVRRSLLLFEATNDQQEKLEIMEDMEIAVVDELRGFLRTHQNAVFAL